ncbi:MAG: putative oxidoreductase [Labilithrix sp.]|nr:putative oxidoreductase [Labilithrix sp.]
MSGSEPGTPTLSAWGRIGAPGREVLADNIERATIGAALCRGLGRSYGDASLPAREDDKVVATRLADRIISFDESTGLLRAEAGLALADINRLLMPRHWFTPVTPGTKYVTLGGMVASDVHGKNHHVDGCFGAHVTKLHMRLADESVVDCSPEENADLFYGTIGGMGLLGHVLTVEFQMRYIASGWITAETERVRGIDEFLDVLGHRAHDWPMTMGWIDCLSTGSSMGRGILTAGRWATTDEAPPAPPPPPALHTFPVELPNWALNPLTAKAFNTAYYWKHFAHKWSGLMTPDAFFYPLDAILEWNRAYGSRGFTQYQCVLPRAAGPQAVRTFMQLLTKLGGASPLCVIKDCGPESKATLSFPLEGTSIAVDMAVSPDLQRIVDHLNDFVIEVGGRIYLAKDRFTRPAHFRAMEPRLDRFFALRDRWDPKRRFRSALSVRLFGDAA